MKRIGIIGSAGTGKSCLAREVAEAVGIHFLPAKVITRDILERLEYDWSSDMYVEKFLAREECQSEMLQRTIDAEETHTPFVTDRTSVDLAAYGVAELHGKSEKVGDIISACCLHARSYTHLILCPWGSIPLHDNKLRTLDPWYQFMIHSLIFSLVNQWQLPYYIVSSDKDSRLQEVLDYIATS